MTSSSQSPGKEQVPPRTIAIVSGKGGSGKTIAAVILGLILNSEGLPLLLVDGDIGTAGMTYYLGLKMVKNTGVGTADIMFGMNTQDSELESSEGSNAEPTLARLVHRVNIPPGAIQPIRDTTNATFLGVGDDRKFYRDVPEHRIPDAKRPEMLEAIINYLKAQPQHQREWIVVDCRGGIDQDSIAICRVADDILLIVEPDTTSFQASKHVVDVLSDNQLAHKLRGFMINKMFISPDQYSRDGTATFRCQYLGSIPFDIQAMRAFLVGDVPSRDSLVGIHVRLAVSQAYPGVVSPPLGRTWTSSDFQEVGLTNLDSLRGGTVVAGLILLLLFIGLFGPARLFYNFSYQPATLILVLALALVGLMGTLEAIRRTIGRLLVFYVRAFTPIFGRGRQ
jgi:septum site-determining protein MinD